MNIFFFLMTFVGVTCPVVYFFYNNEEALAAIYLRFRHNNTLLDR